MCKYLIVLILLTTFISKEVKAEGGLGCGLKPLPPLGCRFEDAVCVCSANGDDCAWVWACRR